MALERALTLTFFVVLCQETKGCNVDSDCLGSQVCCYTFCVSSCLGPQSCVLNSDCNGDNYCCDGICLVDNCVGSACSSDSDCGGPNENCCQNTCQTERCLPGWAIALVVFSSASFFGVIFGFILCTCSYRRSTSRRLLANVNPAPRTAVVGDSTVNYGSVHPPLNAPSPPFYHQPTQNG